MKDITIVTAFFDINREGIKGFNRSNEKYLKAFEFWARIKNKIVVFSDKYTINEVKKIKEEILPASIILRSMAPSPTKCFWPT